MSDRRRPATGRESDGIFTAQVVEDAVEQVLREVPRPEGEQDPENDLREHAGRSRAEVLAQARVGAAEDEYRKALAAVSTAWRERPLPGLLRLAVVIAAFGTVPLAAWMFGWSRALEVPVGSYREVPALSGATFGSAFVVLCALAGTGLLTYLLAARVLRLRREALLAAVALVAAGSTVLLGAGTHGVVADRSGSGTWGLFAFGAAGTVWGVAFTAPIRRWWLARLRPGDARAEQAELEGKRTAWRDEVRSALVSTLRSGLTGDQGRYETSLKIREAPGLRRVRDTSFHVRTDAERLLVKVSKGMDGGSIALCGPRGVGKTELLEAFCAGGEVAEGAPVGLSVVVTAPVAHDRREFMLHLFTELCERARTLGSRPLRKEADRRLERIRYLRTISSETSVNATVRSLGFSATRGASLAREPLTYPEIVKAFKDFLALVADHLARPAKDAARAGPGRAERRLVVGIDELDRIQPASSAREFLNEIKIIFDVPNCLFVLSVSDEALYQADLAPVGRRDVFDSAIDEVVRVDPLDHAGAVNLLKYRVIGLPEPFTSLFNCLACGIPRDLLRIARVATLLSDSHEETLARTAGSLVEREWGRLVNGLDIEVPTEIKDLYGTRFSPAPSPGWEAIDVTTANRFIFLDTVRRVFSRHPAEGTIESACRALPDDLSSFTALARAGSTIGANDRQARASLREIRAVWGLDPIPPVAHGSPYRPEG